MAQTPILEVELDNFPFRSLGYFYYACVVPGSSPLKPVDYDFDLKGTCVQSNATNFFWSLDGHD